jgi:multiple sugar transport system substrate-binding protein
MLSACAAPVAPTTGGETGAAEVAPAAQEAQTVSFINWDEIGGTPYEAVINAYSESTGVTVDVQPAPAEDYETKMRTMIAGGTAADIMRINDDFVRGYSSENALLDLSPYLERDQVNPEDYFASIFEFARQQDGTYTAWSVGCQPSVLYYNKTMFEEAGLPLPPSTWTSEGWTWDEFLTAAQAVSVPGERWGALVYDATAFETVWPVANGEASGIYSMDGTEFTMANPKAVEAIQWVADLTCVHGVQPEWAVVQRSGAGDGLFVANQLGMSLRLFGTVPYFRNNITDFEWDVAPTPGMVDQKAIATIVCFCVPSVAQNPDGAWELLKYMSDMEGATIFANAGTFIPPLLEGAALVQAGDQPPANIPLFIEALNNSVTENFSIHIERARSIYRPVLQLVYTCQQSAEEALGGVREEVEQALAGEI